MTNRYLALSVIASTQLGLRAEEKFLLVRCLHLYGIRPTDLPIHKLTTLMGFGDGPLARARDTLIEKGLLVEVAGVAARTSEERHAGGRPLKAFRVSERCIGLLQKMEQKGRASVGRKAQKGKGRIGWDRDELLGRMMASAHQASMSGLIFWSNDGGVAAEKRSSAVRTEQSERSGKGKNEPSQLRYVTRLLLATLLGLADRGGVVRGVGLGLLARLVGMERQSLEYQLGKLVEEGFLRARTPGVSGRQMYGQSAGALFLNTDEKSLLQTAPQLLICCHDKFIYDECVFVVGRRVYKMADQYRESRLSEARRVKWQLTPFTELKSDGWVAQPPGALVKRLMPPTAIPSAEEAEQKKYLWSDYGTFYGRGDKALRSLWDEYGLYWVFHDDPNSQVFDRHLQSKIEEYASWLLTNMWDRVVAGTWFAPPQLLSQIRAEMLPEVVLESSWSMESRPKFMPEALTYYVYLLALRMAYWLADVLIQDVSPWVKWDWRQLSITALPVPRLRDDEPVRFALSIAASSAESGRGRQALNLVRANVKSNPEARFQIDRDEISLQQPYWLTPLGIKPGLKKGKAGNNPNPDNAQDDGLPNTAD